MVVVVVTGVVLPVDPVGVTTPVVTAVFVEVTGFVAVVVAVLVVPAVLVVVAVGLAAIAVALVGVAAAAPAVGVMPALICAFVGNLMSWPTSITSQVVIPLKAQSC